MQKETPKAARPSGCIIKTHGSTRIFHSWDYADWARYPYSFAYERAVSFQVFAGELTAAPLASLLAKGSLLCRYPSGDVFLSVSGCPLGPYFLRRL